MAGELRVAFLWHFHQPDYRPPGGGAPRLPWVRLHALFGYTDMLSLAARHPGARATFNWVPDLWDQWQDLAGGQDDAWLALCRRAPRDLAPAERSFLGEFLRATPRCFTATLPRLKELQERWRQLGALEDGEWLDLVVLFHLAWSGAELRLDPQVQRLLAQATFTAEDRDLLWDRQRELVGSLHARAMRLLHSGHVELSTSPCEHPILPLLLDLDSRDFPQAGGGQDPFRFSSPEDAWDHVRRAREAHQRRFGTIPKGMWPAEGAVSEEAAALFARAGCEWIASDEAVLFASDPRLTRGDLYQPFTLSTSAGDLRVLFRDHELSDRIGFTYQSWSETDAVEDLLGRLDAIRAQSTLKEPVVSIILDGENPWEHYQGGGRPFLEALWKGLAEQDQLIPCTVAEAAALPPRSLDRLAAGSWIHGRFDTWAGDAQKLRAWRLMKETRELATGRRLEELSGDVARSLRILQGSDWYWWLGDDHPSEHAERFDALFLAHRDLVYRSHGLDPPPARLRVPLDVLPRQWPKDELDPRGEPADELQWQSAGVFDWSPGSGAMAAAGAGGRVLFGWDDAAWHLAVEGSERALRVEVDQDGVEPYRARPGAGAGRQTFRVPRRGEPELRFRLVDAADPSAPLWPRSGHAVIRSDRLIPCP